MIGMEKQTYYTLLHIDQPQVVEAYLRERAWLELGESVQQLSPAGEGNMNLTLRVATDLRTFIVKQSRPWVEKYPSIPAPEDRVLMEAEFYQAVSHFGEIAERMPRLLGCDEQNFVALFEDLGGTADFTDLYNDGLASFAPLHRLCQWLAALHGAEFDLETRQRLENIEMRKLNHEHLYCYPLRHDNGFDLDAITPGLAAVAAELKGDAAYLSAIAELGERYLENGPSLLHGDFYPGSWVSYTARQGEASSDNIWVIDPEFCFFGPAEFDLGILIGHLLLAGRSPTLFDEVFAGYRGAASFNRELALRFAGMEIMRRLIGVAQLPLIADLAQKEALLATSRELLLRPESFFR